MFGSKTAETWFLSLVYINASLPQHPVHSCSALQYMLAHPVMHKK